MPKVYAVESVISFYEVNLVEADSPEEAAEIAEHSDYNASKYLGRNVSVITEFKDEDRQRYSQLDTYFFEGYASVADDGSLIYKRMDGTLNGSMSAVKIK
jgi:hypothetical protein